MDSSSAHMTPELAIARAERFQTSSSWDVLLKQERNLKITERASLVEKGLINEKVNLEDAVAMQGTCDDMCPALERIERKIQRQLDPLEMIPGTSDPDPARCVKMFHRPTATLENLPSDVRPPAVLERTLNYLLHTVLDGSNTFDRVHLFIRDRTRSIRQDFAIQHTSDSITISCHERIARFHVVALHEMRSAPVREDASHEVYSEQQEVEQLNKTLTSLMHLYDDARHTGRMCKYEPEFRAYNLLLHITNPDVIRQTELLPMKLLVSPPLNMAVDFCSLVQRTLLTSDRLPSSAFPHLFTRFFKLVSNSSTPFLMACLLEHHFAEIRKAAFSSMANSFLPNLKTPGMPVVDIWEMLCFDEDVEVLEFAVDICNLEVSEGPGIRLNRKTEIAPTPKGGHPIRTQSWRLVKAKKGDSSWRDIVDGIVRKPSLGMIPIPAQTLAPPFPLQVSPQPPAMLLPRAAPHSSEHRSELTQDRPHRSSPVKLLPTSYELNFYNTISATGNSMVKIPQARREHPRASGMMANEAVAQTLPTSVPSALPAPSSSTVGFRLPVHSPIPAIIHSTESEIALKRDVAQLQPVIGNQTDNHRASLTLQVDTQILSNITRDMLFRVVQLVIQEKMAAELRDHQIRRRFVRKVLNIAHAQLEKTHEGKKRTLRSQLISNLLDTPRMLTFDELSWDESYAAGQPRARAKWVDQNDLNHASQLLLGSRYKPGGLLDMVRRKATAVDHGTKSNWTIWFAIDPTHQERQSSLFNRFVTQDRGFFSVQANEIVAIPLEQCEYQQSLPLGLLIFPVWFSETSQEVSGEVIDRLKRMLSQVPSGIGCGPPLLVLLMDPPHGAQAQAVMRLQELVTSYRRLSGQAKIAASFEGEADDAFLDHLAGLSLGGSEKQESWLDRFESIESQWNWASEEGMAICKGKRALEAEIGNNAQSYLLGLLIGLVEAKFQFAIGDSNGRDAFGTTARLPSITGQSSLYHQALSFLNNKTGEDFNAIASEMMMFKAEGLEFPALRFLGSIFEVTKRRICSMGMLNPDLRWDLLEEELREGLQDSIRQLREFVKSKSGKRDVIEDRKKRRPSAPIFDGPGKRSKTESSSPSPTIHAEPLPYGNDGLRELEEAMANAAMLVDSGWE